MTDEREQGRLLVRRSVLLAVLLASGLSALGRFREALALTLGAAVAIVSARWLSGVVARLLASDPRTRAGLDWKFALRAALRYLFIGAAIWAALLIVPADVPWLLAGLSVVVVVLGAQGLGEAWRAGRRGS